MPEGDTVHRAAAELRAMLRGRVPDEVATPSRRLAALRLPERLRGRAVRSVDARGKHLLVGFEGAVTLHSHLRMTGAWDVHRRGARWRRAHSRAWLTIACGEQEAVQFDGPVLELLSDVRVRTHPQLARLGQDVLGESFDEALFVRALRADDPARTLGDALLDQRLIAGIGNVWKAESCFAAGVDPWRALADVGDEQALAVVAFAREHMRACVRDGFAARPRAVYRRAGRPCPRCGAPIRSRGQGDDNRTTYWCAGCQR